ncbi:MAG: transporter substrate-binding domain-containing protein [Bacteroidota bacterium]
MKKLFKTALFFALAVAFNSTVWAQYSGDTYASAKSKGTASWVFTYSKAPGFANENSSGIMTGICVDLMNKFKEYVEKEEGIKVAVKYQVTDPDNFTLFLDEVKQSNGGVFGLSNTTITKARKASYKFSPPYITNIGMILSNNAVPTLTDLKDISTKFAGMSAVTVKNSTNAKRLQEIKSKHFAGLKIEYVPSFAQVMDIVAKSPRKFTNIDFTYYFEAVQKRKPIKRHPGGDDPTEEFGIIMPLSNDWTPILEKFMNEGFVGGVEYKKIISKNLGQGAMKFFDSLNN